MVLRYSKGLQTLSRYAVPPPIDRQVEVHLHLGKTGTGKTYDAVHSVENPSDVYIKDTGKWFDNYIGQPVIVMDDFAGASSHISLAETLRLLDAYRYQVEVKGSYEWLRATTIYVTSNLYPRAWYKWESREEQYHALLRRFTTITYYRSRDSKVTINNRRDFADFPERYGYTHPTHNDGQFN